MWAGYSWTQAHREGLQFQTADVAEALVSAVVIFAAGAALGGAVRPLRRRSPRLAAYVTLAAPVLALGAIAVQEATDTQVGGSVPVVDVLGVACAWACEPRSAGAPTRGPDPGAMAELARGHRHRWPRLVGGRRVRPEGGGLRVRSRPARPVPRWSTHVHACPGCSRAPLPGGGRRGEPLRGRHGHDRRPVTVPRRLRARP